MGSVFECLVSACCGQSFSSCRLQLPPQKSKTTQIETLKPMGTAKCHGGAAWSGNQLSTEKKPISYARKKMDRASPAKKTQNIHILRSYLVLVHTSYIFKYIYIYLKYIYVIS